MKVRLRVLHGRLMDKEGHGRGMEVKIHGPRFVIGSAEDCAMCCKSTSVSPQHCEIFVGQHEASVRSLNKEADTFINGQPVEHEQILHHGDRLRVGRLEFEVLIEAPVRAADAAEDHQHEEQKLSDMLAEADAKERAFRLQHPELRELHLESAPPKEADAAEQAKEDPEGGKKKGKKFKKLPRKLPVPPAEQTEDSTEAAVEALRKMFRP